MTDISVDWTKTSIPMLSTYSSVPRVPRVAETVDAATAAGGTRWDYNSFLAALVALTLLCAGSF
jgi:hypothetical protein